MALKPYRTLLKAASDEFIVNKSRFIGYGQPCETEEEALAFLAEIRARHKDASHNCYAYIIGPNMGVMRYSDDGEPGGTAGMPIIEVLKARNVTNCAVVVTRYFGGVLLGAGGLVRAYSRSVQVGLAASKIIEKTEGTLLSIRTDYNGIGKIQYLLGQRGLTITDSQYTDIVELETLVPQDQLTELKEAITEGTNGRAAFTKEEAVCFAFVVGEPLIF